MNDQTSGDSRGFDFLFGAWRVTNRRLVDRADPSCEKWEAFDATARVEPVLGGLGHVDRFVAPDLPRGGALEGLTLRLFEPAGDAWRIWWADGDHPGRLDPPMTGRFLDGVGHFEGEDVLDGRAVTLRFIWTPPAETGPRWEQSFSWDGGATWKPNWIMQLRREAT